MDKLRSILLAGLGAAVLTREKVETTLRRLVDEGRLTAEEAQKLTDELTDQGRQEWDDLRGRAGELVHESLASVDVASRKRLLELEEKVARLESRVGMLEDRLADQPGGCED